MNTVKIDGVSSDTVRLRFDKIPLIPAAKRRTETYSIPGAGEDLTINTPDFDDIQLTLTAYLVGGTTIQDVYEWIRLGSKLVLSTQPGIYGVIKAVGEIAPTRAGWDAHKIDIPLTLSPFKFRVDNDAVEITTSPATLETIGNIYSFPTYALTGLSGDVTFTVNGTTLTIEDTPATVYIDTDAQTVYKLNGTTPESILSSTSGEFWKMILCPGNVPNAISWTGTVGGVSVVKNERWV